MCSSCGWCGEGLGGDHSECARALESMAQERDLAARGAAVLAGALLEEAALLHASARMVERMTPAA